MSTRADPLANLDKFEPKVKPVAEPKAKQQKAEIEKLASAHGFNARVKSPAAPVARSMRRYKTGRNVQINVKGEQETKDELYRLADVIDEPLGETLKRALAALDREIQTSKK